MASLPIYSTENKQVGAVDVPDHFSLEGKDFSSVVHQAIVMQRASVRQGTASTRGRGEVSGSGKKPWKQKHTGRARSGSVRSPIWRHGGVAFGPKPRTYGFHMPRKMYRLAMRAALGSKIEEGSFIVIENFDFHENKTKLLGSILSGLGVFGKTILLSDGNNVDDLNRAGRNIRNLKVLSWNNLNIYDLMWCEKLVVSQSALEKIKEMWG